MLVVLKLDVTKETDIEAAFARVEHECDGRLFALINNAGRRKCTCACVCVCVSVNVRLLFALAVQSLGVFGLAFLS